MGKAVLCPKIGKQRSRKLDDIQSQIDLLEKLYGPVAARKARQIAERLYDVLVGSTVHDMQNILSPMQSTLNSLCGHLADGNLDAECFDKNLRKLEYQLYMIKRMLEDMRIYVQPASMQRHSESVADMVREAHSAVLDTFRATERDVSMVAVEIEVPDDLIIQAVRFDMVRALINLIKNAYESHATTPYSFATGKVFIAARSLDCERLEIIIGDNGMGLSLDELEELRRFMPGGTSKKTHGTGFGLPIAKRKIEAHGGLLAIESEEDRGTLITVTLPQKFRKQ